MDVLHFSQKQLAQRWSIGPPYLKLPGQVRYRLKDIEAFEESCLRSSTSTAIRSAG
ncbi:MAG: DNA-binding protein [Betaproteobacteria bacterium]|nr:DNA-binding protein [Betaproteobacteria bacterium]